MTDQSIFGEGEGSQDTPAPISKEEPQVVDQLLAGIVNAEGKQKYATIEEALKGAANAQEHISRLEQENSTFKQEVEKSTTLQDVLEAMKPKPEAQEGGDEKPATPALDEGVLAQLLEKVVERKETESTLKANAATVANKFRELHGDQAEAKYLEAAASVGMSKADINKLAATSPQAVFAMLGVDTKKEQASGFKSSVSASEFQQKPNLAPKFDPMQPSPNSAVAKWREVSKATNERLGVDK